jgi:hypothetical protein
MSEPEKESNEPLRVRIASLLYAGIYLFIVIYLIAFPVFDLQITWVIYTGSSVHNVATISWWILLVFVLFNLWLPLQLIGSVAEYDHPARIDIHYLLAIVVTGINLIFFVIFCLIFFFLMNSSYSGNQPFNSPFWYCNYYIDQPQLCPNINACASTVSLSPNDQFYILWIFTAVLTVLAFVHIIFNRLLRISKSVGDNYQEGLVMGVVFHLIFLVLLCYVFAFPVFDLNVPNGYLLFGIPPSPGPFYAGARYYWQWWNVWLVFLNLAPILSFFGVMILDPSFTVTKAHFWISILVGIITFISFCIFLGILAGYTNYPWSGNSIGNNPAYCFQFYDAQPSICPNVGPSLAPTSFQWVPNTEVIQLTVFSGIFWILDWCSCWLNGRMRRYGIFG